ncbi:SMEK domain-containing protein [Bradyrhizobium quebecense]|uniref:SMEK domain-containing protein n=2 Tax=Bradyrhizobium quebecense TaxID=2748629 RepID=A0ACD3V7Y9_9BRAD|nr:SMEK domain-containing protein [Bradyrhizobium quebecense]UGY02470.1 SMEK domain-containing protein [Bradyrhizobium quebecense]
MLTRGYFIGEIVDALSDIAGQVSTRGRLGLTDLNKHAEDFFKTILNHLFSLSLVNLNSERSNEPGLDLGDKTNKVAFQITATRTSAKVNDMLETLSDEQIAAYSKIRVLMIAGKQSSYTLDAGQCARASFSAEDIWDIHDLGKRCMDLTVDVLQLIYNHVHSELARIKIELEIPDTDGKYPTTLADFIEAIPKPQMSDLIKFNKLLEEEGVEEDLATTQNAFAAFSVALAKLPRITREFLVMLIERREIDRKHGNSRIEINADKLARISRYPDNAGELRVLDAYGFVWLDEPDEAGESAHWRVILPGLSPEQRLLFLQYMEANGIPLSRPLVALDFSAF